MKNSFLLLLLSIFLFSCNSTSDDESDKEIIISILKNQEKAWSENNIDAFMQGYWNSDSLKFYGASGLTYGYQNTLENYKERYPTKEHTGTLNFKINDISKINEGSYYVMGEFHLTRPIEDAQGVFMIIFKKINGEWKIIADTSC